jgi:hypothetical protein
MGRTRFKRYIQGASSGIAGFPQSLDLRMGTSSSAVPTFGYHLSAPHQNGPDGGIRRGFPDPLARLADRETHHRLIEFF